MSLTDKQKAQREKDVVVKYGRSKDYADVKAKVEGLVQEKWESALNAERKALWRPEEDVIAIPTWTPQLSPHVARVIGASMDQVAKFMVTISRQEKTAIVKKLVSVVMKESEQRVNVAPEKNKGVSDKWIPVFDAELVESLVWRQLFDLLKDQGVNLKAEIKKLTA